MVFFVVVLAIAANIAVVTAVATGLSSPPSSCDGDDAATAARFPLVSCCYFLGNGDARAHLRDDADGGDDDAPHDGGHLILKRAPDGDFSYVDPTPDALVLWRSKLAYHARAPVRRGSSLAVKHWIFAGADPNRGA